MTVETQNRNIRQAELQLAISKAIAAHDEKANPAFGVLTCADVVLVLTRLSFEWSQRLFKKGK